MPDSTVSNADYALRAMDLGHGIISTMEHGNQGRYIEGYKLAKEHGLKFVFGTEAYWVKDRTTTDSANCHIYLGARNENGRQCINDVLSEAALTGFYKRPRIDLPLLMTLPAQDVIVTTACVAFWKYDDIDTIVAQLAEHFGKSFYLEVQYHCTQPQQELNRHILTLRDQLKLPIIMGCDSHYIYPAQMSDREDFLLSKNIHYEDEEGWFLDYPNGDEAYNRFIRQGVLTPVQIDEAMSNTNIFLDVQDYDCPVFDDTLKLPSIPRMKNWPQAQKDAEYERLVWQGWDNYKSRVPPERHEHYISEIQAEIDTVKQCGMADYFLIDYEVLRRGRELGGLVTTTGRGSAVSFITNMLLGFTEVDRIAAKVTMYPSRFMTAERILEANVLPDVDINVADPTPFAKAQQEILGEDHAYPMISYHPMKTSKAWKLYAKAQCVSFEEANGVSEEIRRYEEAVKQADEDSKDDIDIMDYISPKYHEIFANSATYRGIVDSWSIAPCGYLLYDGNIRREIGLVRINDHICCMMDGHWAEDGHFLKNDLLRVSIVSLINQSYARIGMKVPTVNELIAMCPPDDPAWDIYRKGCCMGVNQVERKGTAARCSNYQPTNISELCAFVAAIRPGFRSLYGTFESRQPFEYGVKAFDDLMKTDELPFAFCLYQEQEMAALHYAGIPMSDCYTAIKDIAKKRAAKVMAYREKFLSGFTSAIMRDEGRSEPEAQEIALKLWQVIEDSARYSFNACVSGDTIIAHDGAEQITVEELYISHTYGRYLKISGNQKFRTAHPKREPHLVYSMDEHCQIFHNELVSIRPAGNREVFRVDTDSGASITCTANHKFPIPLQADKRLDELRIGDELFFAGSDVSAGSFVTKTRITGITSLGKQRTYNVEMADPYHNFVTSTGIVTSNSHSYCVSCDSLYIAWIKAHYPLELYETLLKFYDSRGEKDKINDAKAEAKRFFGIKFPPMRYGQDNRAISGDKSTLTITDSISSIKGFSHKVGRLLYESAQQPHATFMDVLFDLDRRGVKAKVEPLIKLDYFQQFGNQRELLRLWAVFNLFKQGEAKTMRREQIDGTIYEEPVRRHATWHTAKGEEAKSYTLTDVHALLLDIESSVMQSGLPDLEDDVKVKNYIDIMGQGGYVSGRDEDRPKLYIKEVFPLKRKKDGKQFGYTILTQSIGSGIESRFTVFNSLYETAPIHKGDLIVCTDYERDGQYFTLRKYRHIGAV